MSVGVTVTRDDVDSAVGQLAAEANDLTVRIDEFRRWSDSKTEQDLLDLGYQQDDVTLVKTVALKLGLWSDLYNGREALAVAEPLRQFPDRVQGLGITR